MIVTRSKVQGRNFWLLALTVFFLSLDVSGCLYDYQLKNKSDAGTDECPDDDQKTRPGVCGCGVPDIDTNEDGVLDCNDTIDSLDDSFGIAGEFLYPSALGDDRANDAVTAPDGSIFITGYLSNGTDSDLLLMKLTSNGILDTTFHETGYITRHNIAGGNGSDEGHSINLTPDGDLLISGTSLGPGGYSEGLLWKVSTGGVDDASFGTSGTYLLDISEDMSNITATYDSKTGNVFAVGLRGSLIHGFRILADGSGFDTSFSGDGIIKLYPFKSIYPSLNTLADGSLLVAGACQPGGRYTACSWLVDALGNLNTSYTNYNNQTLAHNELAGGSGPDSWNAILPYPKNRLVLAGASESVSNSQDEVVARVNISDGSFDTSFGGGDGFWTEDVLGLGKLGRVKDAIVTQDGSITAALEVITAAGDWDVAVIKLDANGVRDMSFASGTGVLQLGGAYEDRGPHITEQPDGRILVVTSQYNDTESDIVVWAVL